MNKINYDKVMQDIINKVNGKPSLLLHSCCAPCSTACIERLKDYFNLTVYYYNPNLDSVTEFNLRSSEQIRLCNEYGVNVVIQPYEATQFYSVVKGLEMENEGGARCEKCFALRLTATAEYAKQNGFNYFATTLTVSPLKNAQKINEIGEKISKETGVNYLPTDFKKGGGYLKTIELSKKYQLYRQNYCGCAYSKRVEN